MFILLLSLIVIPSISFIANADDHPFIVRVIYFRAQGAPATPHEKYDKLIKRIQDFFRDEMIKHGRGDKTFKIETDARGKLKIVFTSFYSVV